jgi:hypothetical protein
MALIDFMDENRIPMAFTALVLLIGTVAYFSEGAPNSVPMAQLAKAYDGMRLKVAFSDTGDLELYSNAVPSIMSKLPAAEGVSVPDDGTMVLGFSEGMGMKKENEISGPGSRLTDLYGINVSINGILGKTGGPIDMMHFLATKDFDAIEGKEGKVAVLMKGTMPKVFFYYEKGDRNPRISLAEGSLGNYGISEKNGKQYIPILIGADEAKMMRSEKLFSKPGDELEGFFGKNVKIAGILAKTNSALDMVHIVPREFGQ